MSEWVVGLLWAMLDNLFVFGLTEEAKTLFLGGNSSCTLLQRCGQVLATEHKEKQKISSIFLPSPPIV